MRSQFSTTAATPIPDDLPFEVVVAFLQTYSSIIRHNPNVVSIEELPSIPSFAIGDPFFEPWDDTIRAFEASEVTQLAPGLRRASKWPMVFQSIVNGTRCSGTAAGGISTWNTWTVRPQYEVIATTTDESSPGTMSSGTMSSGTMSSGTMSSGTMSSGTMSSGTMSSAQYPMG
ncbi:hypothetical protein G7Z17_g2145 [Cylindrodendrum hubeiense]|uniref:DUF7053 domain-containing protein n=1 Tax=Cylindrodendrum hubeiense TaxID=595255 RepID=A0A9P5HDE4_9HYPO|nr:hypothetical protein G7Z17_g2145 [Cylindrodendrum hubeiense]